MDTAAPRSIGSRAAGLALLLAWLALLGGIGAALGYVLFLPERDAGLETRRAVMLRVPAAEPGPWVQSPTPGNAAAEAAPQPAPAETRDTASEPPPAPEVATEEAEEIPTAEAVTEEAVIEEAVTEEAVTEEAGAAPTETQEAALPRLTAPEIAPPWLRHAQPFKAPKARPRIAIVLTGLGLSSAATEAAIKQLPGPVSLSFTPYSRRLNEWIALARVNGHEVLLDLPMEPTSYPDDDPGPQALLTALSERQNLERLDWALRRATGFIGVAAVMGSRFLASEEHMTPILTELKSRGLLFLDSRADDSSVAGPLAQKIGMANAVNDRFLDRAQASRVAIDARLIQLERIARKEGFAVAIGQTYPVTIERLRVWVASVESRGFALAPLSSVAAERVARQTASRQSPAP